MNSHLDLYSSPMRYGSEPVSQGQAQLSNDENHAHLSDDQIDNYLIGDLAAGVAAHLAICSICTDRAAAAASPIASFQNVTMAWSERCSATLPIPNLTRQQSFWHRHMAWVAVCFVFTIGVALINAGHQVAVRTAELLPMQQNPTQQDLNQQAAQPSAMLTETASATVAPEEAQIFADDQLLQAIDDDLDASADSPVTLGIEPVSTPSRRPPTTVSVRD